MGAKASMTELVFVGWGRHARGFLPGFSVDHRDAPGI